MLLLLGGTMLLAGLGVLSLDYGSAAAEGAGSLSLGNPNDGSLVRGVRLPDRGPGFYSNPHSPNPDAKYGTDETIRAIARVGLDLERWAPGATLYVNDIGFREGGPISRHQSHRAGRDADFLFYMNDLAGNVARPKGVRFDGSGAGTWNAGTPADPSDDRRLVFDTRRNWLVVRSLLENDDARLQRVFVSEGLRSLMLDWARENGEPDWVLERAADVMCEPATPHDDHFHIRLFCTADDYRQGCRDTWPLYPWRRTQLAARGLLEVELGLRPPTKSGRPARPRLNTPGRLWCP